jgi:hypothetical protein
MDALATVDCREVPGGRFVTSARPERRREVSDEARLRAALIQVIKGVLALRHGKPYDLKPSNVLVSGESRRHSRLWFGGRGGAAATFR